MCYMSNIHTFFVHFLHFPLCKVKTLLISSTHVPGLITADSFNYLTHQATQSPTVLKAACEPISTDT